MLQVFTPVRTTDCFLSIGTGTPLSQQLPFITSPKGFLEAITGILANRDVVNILFRSLINAFAPRGTTRKYWRFNFGDGLPDWVEEDGVSKWVYLAKREETDVGEMDDVKVKGLIEKKTDEYTKEPGFKKQLSDCTVALRGS